MSPPLPGVGPWGFARRRGRGSGGGCKSWLCSCPGGRGVPGRSGCRTYSLIRLYPRARKAARPAGLRQARGEDGTSGLGSLLHRELESAIARVCTESLACRSLSERWSALLHRRVEGPRGEFSKGCAGPSPTGRRWYGTRRFEGGIRLAPQVDRLFEPPPD